MNLDHLISKFKPILVLHPFEEFFPASIDFILLNSSLYLDNQCIVPKERLTLDNLSTYSKRYGCGVYVEIDPYIWDGEAYNLNDVPYYLTYYETDKHYVLQFFFLYVYNGKKQFDHKHISLFINKNSEQLDKAFYSDIGDYGVWLDRKDIIMYWEQPIIFVSKLSHNNYNKLGKRYCKFGFSNDLFADGYHWEPKHCVIVDNNTSWNQFTGTFGKNGTRVPRLSSWWKHEFGKNSNWIQRFFGCL